MPKRKAPCPRDGLNKPSVSSLDAAFDLLASETFSKIDHIVKKFEAATCILLNDGVAKARWEEACKRYWVTKAMEDLCCGSKPPQAVPDMSGNVDMKGDAAEDEGRPLPQKIHPGPVIRHKMSSGEELEWKKWTPRVGDMVLADLSNDESWPGKIIDRRAFFQGRATPRGNHFFAVRIYSEGIEPVIMVRSRMIPLELRPEPPLLASTSILTAFNHARHPAGFDKAAEEREKKDARERSHSGVHGPDEQQRIKARKEAWNEQVNWIMNERRVEKMRNLNEERDKRLQEVAKEPEIREKAPVEEEWGPSNSKRNCIDASQANRDKGVSDGIFSVQSAPSRSLTASPLFKPTMASPQRPGSPRRLEKRRNGIYAGMGEYSPRGRRTTYTPPRILPSGDETAPGMQTSPSPVPSSLRFDFVSPLGPVHAGTLADGSRRSGSLEAVKEEPLEDEGSGEWTVVQKRGQRSGSAPCRDRAQKAQDGKAVQAASAGMEVEVS